MLARLAHLTIRRPHRQARDERSASPYVRVPRAFGEPNWWMPDWICTALRVDPRELATRRPAGALWIPDQGAAFGAERLIHPSELFTPAPPKEI